MGVDSHGDARSLLVCHRGDRRLPSAIGWWTARASRAGGQHCNGSGSTGSYQVTVARLVAPVAPQRESTGLARGHQASGTTGQTLATTTTATSLQWNKIQHRLCSQITMNWRGRPLTSHEVVVNPIASTRTRTGLRVGPSWTPAPTPPRSRSARPSWRRSRSIGTTPTGRGITPSIPPPTRPPCHRPGRRAATPARRAATLRMLSAPRLSGLRPQDLDRLARQLTPAQAAVREQRWGQQRGGRRRKAPGAHGRPSCRTATVSWSP